MKKYNGRKKTSRKSVTPNDGFIEILPYEITMYKIFRFVPSKDLFNNLQRVNTLFFKLIWRSIEKSNIYDEDIIIPSRIRKTKVANKWGAYNPELPRREFYPKSLIFKTYFPCNPQLFRKLCEAGAFNVDKCFRNVFDHLYKVMCQPILRLANEQDDTINEILKTMQVITDLHDGMIEDPEMDLKESYFHESMALQNKFLIRFFIENRDKFRVPKVEESSIYLQHPENYEAKSKCIVEFMKCYPTLVVSQSLFERYVTICHMSQCTCCDSNAHLNGILKEFLSHYFKRYSSHLEEEEEEEELKIIPNRVLMTTKMIDRVREQGPKRDYFGQGKKIRLILRFIKEFGVYDTNPKLVNNNNNNTITTEVEKKEEETSSTTPIRKYTKLNKRDVNEMINSLSEQANESDIFDSTYKFSNTYLSLLETRDEQYVKRLENEANSVLSCEDEKEERRRAVYQNHQKENRRNRKMMKFDPRKKMKKFVGFRAKRKILSQRRSYRWSERRRKKTKGRLRKKKKRGVLKMIGVERGFPVDSVTVF